MKIPSRPFFTRSNILVGLAGTDALGVVGGGREVPEMPLTGSFPPVFIAMHKINAHTQ